MASDDFMSQLLNASPNGAAVAPATPSSGDFISDMLNKSPPPTSMTVSSPDTSRPAPPDWGVMQSLANGALLGGYVPLKAYAQSKAYGVPYEQAKANVAQSKSAYEASSPLSSGLAELGGSVPTTLAALATMQDYAVAPFVARAATLSPRLGEALGFATGSGGTNMLTRGLSRAGGGVLQGAETGAISGGLTNESPSEGAASGAFVGAVANPLLGPLGSKLASNVSPAVANMADRFISLGVPLKTGQIPGAPGVTAPFAKTTADQVSSFNRALSHTFGEDTPNLNNELLFGAGGGDRGAAGKIGQKMENIVSNYDIPATHPTLAPALANIRSDVMSDLSSVPGAQSRMLAHLDNIDAELASGGINGKAYQAMTKFGSPLYRDLASKDPNLSHYAGEIKSALDDAWSSSLPVDKSAAWNNAKAQYKNLITIKPALDETTQQANPNALYRSVLRKNNGSSASAGDLGTLAEGAKNFLQPNESAGFHLSPAGAVGLGAAGLVGEHFGAPLAEHLLANHPIAAGAAGALGAGYLGAGAAMSSPAYAAYIARNAGRGLTLPANPGIPILNYLYNDGAQR